MEFEVPPKHHRAYKLRILPKIEGDFLKVPHSSLLPSNTHAMPTPTQQVHSAMGGSTNSNRTPPVSNDRKALALSLVAEWQMDQILDATLHPPFDPLNLSYIMASADRGRRVEGHSCMDVYLLYGEVLGEKGKMAFHHEMELCVPNSISVSTPSLT